MRNLLGIILMFATPHWLLAEEFIMGRIKQPYSEAMLHLQDSIRGKGYEVMHVQRIDVGLQSRGFTTAEYRVIFFGKPQEVSTLTHQHPHLMPFLPLKIVLYAEGESTMAVANNPLLLGRYFESDGLHPHLTRWEKDIRLIIGNARLAGQRTQDTP